MLLTRPRWLAGMSYLPFHTPELKILMVSFISSFIPYKQWCRRLFSRTRYYNKFFHLPYLPVLQNAFTQCCLNQEHHSRDRDMLRMRLLLLWKADRASRTEHHFGEKGEVKANHKLFQLCTASNTKTIRKMNTFFLHKAQFIFQFCRAPLMQEMKKEPRAGQYVKMIPTSQSIAAKILPVWFLGNPSYCFGLKNNGSNNFQMWLCREI